MIRHARKQAERSTFRQRLGAVITKGDRVLSSACNELRYNRNVPQKFPESLHAEAAAVAKLLKDQRLHDLAGSTIYVCRINRAGTSRLAWPCLECYNLLKAVGVRKIVYTTSNGSTATEGV